MRSLALIALVLVTATAATTLSAGDDPPPFKITTKRADDRVEEKTEKDKVIFSVHSPFGISHAGPNERRHWYHGDETIGGDFSETFGTPPVPE